VFDLGPDKILMVLAVACVCLGPKELPAAARRIGQIVRQVRSWQDQLRAELESVVHFDSGGADAGIRAAQDPVPPPAPGASDPRDGASFT